MKKIGTRYVCVPAQHGISRHSPGKEAHGRPDETPTVACSRFQVHGSDFSPRVTKSSFFLFLGRYETPACPSD